MRLLDLFSGAGGAAVGYHRAGFDVTGVDLVNQPRYPFEFVQGDALKYLTTADLSGFDAIHASPPCKTSTSLRAFSGAHHEDLIPQTRAALIATGLPYVIENVPGASLLNPITLCGSSFGLDVRRHRLFESNVALTARACDHRGQAARSPGYPVKRYHSGRPVVTMSPVIGVFGRGQGLGDGEVDLWRRAMGIDWMNRDEMAQAIPPAFTQHIGEWLLAALTQEAAA